MKLGPLFAFLLALAACSAETPAPPAAKALSCEASETGAVTADGAWLREQKDMNASSAAYFSLCNGAMAPATLTDLSTPAAAIAMFHETSRDDKGIVSMVPAGEITLSPGERVVFAPGGKHVMLMSLSGPIVSGEHAPLTLHFADGAAITVDAVAKSNVEAAMDEHEGH
ncbi:MAG: copper chaperone PCu(A)C [Pseudomonadota bacterium]